MYLYPLVTASKTGNFQKMTTGCDVAAGTATRFEALAKLPW